MTDGAFRSFIKGGLRHMTMKWKPKIDAKKNARHHTKLPNAKGRLVYHSLCASCGELKPETTCSVDHIDPIIDPDVGFISWDEVIERMFCEEDGLQVLCSPCHDAKTAEEKERDTKRRRAERLQRSGE